MPSSIKDEDKPVSLVIDQATAPTTYVVNDVHGNERARFTEQSDASDYVAEVNAIPPPAALLQKGIADNNVAHDQEDREQQKVEVMPRGIPKKKKAPAKKRAASVKKVAKKVGKTAKKAAKRRKKSRYED